MFTKHRFSIKSSSLLFFCFGLFFVDLVFVRFCIGRECELGFFLWFCTGRECSAHVLLWFASIFFPAKPSEAKQSQAKPSKAKTCLAKPSNAKQCQAMPSKALRQTLAASQLEHEAVSSSFTHACKTRRIAAVSSSLACSSVPFH